MAKRFRFTADIEFEAFNAVEAATKLADHFINVAAQFESEDAPDDEQWFVGRMEFKPDA